MENFQWLLVVHRGRFLVMAFNRLELEAVLRPPTIRHLHKPLAKAEGYHIERQSLNMAAGENPKMPEDFELILGNSNPRFSGVTSTMLQTLTYQQKMMSVRVLGDHHLPDEALAISFWEAAQYSKRPRADGKQRVFHARRNDEMIQALVLRFLFGAKFKIVFTSTAQRQHSGLSRWLMSKMDAILSTCQAAANYLESPPAKIIAHGIDAENYFPSTDREQLIAELGLPGERLIGMFGRVREQKGVHLFVRSCIELLPQHPETSAVIVGAISSDNQSWVDGLKQEVEAAGLADRVLFTGELAFEDLPQYFSACSVVSALSRNEGFGLTVLEAMSSGAAVIATQAGAWPEVVRDGVDGYVVPVEDQEAVTASLNTLLTTPEKAQAMGASGRQRILDHYTIEREAEQLCDFFRTLQ